MAAATVTQRTTKHSNGLTVDKAAVSHTVATTIGYTVVGHRGIVGSDRQRRFADGPDGTAHVARQRVVRQQRATVGGVIAVAQVHRHRLAASRCGCVIAAGRPGHACAFAAGKTAQGKVAR